MEHSIKPCDCKKDSFTAVIDRMPPGKPRLTVRGEVTCPTTGFKVLLEKAVPPGINPSQLLLNVVIQSPSGITGQQVKDYRVEYRQDDSPPYESVKIQPCDLLIPVKSVS